jgi:hypothetical protein
MNQDPHQPTLGVDRDLSLNAFGSFVRVESAGPLFSAVWTDWLSIMSTIGSVFAANLQL